MSSRSPLEQLRRLDRSSSRFHDQVSNILYGEDYKQWVPTVQDNDLMGLVDCLDKALDNLDPSSSAFRKCLRELRHVCGTRTILPPSHTLSPQALTVDRQPIASGGSGDVYEGSFNGSKVCVKRVRIYSKEGSKKATKTLYQEAVVWKHLEHRNIVPLLGITPTPLQLISEWMPGGDLTDYIRKYPGADRVDILCDVAEGLHFLHSRSIVHGGLKGPNIFVDDTGHARITDFGLATVTQNLDSMHSASNGQDYTARWTAPEILSEQGTYNKEADVFSFAMVMIEVFTGAVPFNNDLPAAAVLAIIAGKRPPRPAHHQLTNQLWTLMQRCWDQDPHLRPEVSEVFRVLCGRDPIPIKPTIYRVGSASTLTSLSAPTAGRQQLLTGYSPMPSRPSSLYNKPSTLLQDLYELDRSFSREIDRISRDEGYVDELLQLPESELIQLVNYLDDTLSRLAHIDVSSRKCLHMLQKICSTRRVIPATFDVSGALLPPEEVGPREFSDRYKGSLSAEVCIKNLRIYSHGNQDATKELFCKEAVMWKHLKHPNIITLKGITFNPLQLVSEWVSSGELREYIKKNTDANPINLLLDIAEGLAYLHARGVVHGDLNGQNIVVDKSGNARITDFGLASIARSSAASVTGYTPQLIAPEMLQDGTPASKKSDIFSFAMVMFEVFTGQIPFHDTPGAVTASIIDGKRPSRPTHPELTDASWELTEKCWAASAEDRPEVEKVIEVLKRINTSRTSRTSLPPEGPIVATHSGVVSRLYRLDRSFAFELDGVLHDEGYVDGLMRLPENELIQLVNYLDYTLNRLTYIDAPPKKCLNVLRRICGSRRVLPATYDVSKTLFAQQNPIANRGFYDIHRGLLSTEVCIEKLRISSDQNQSQEVFCKEAVVWKRLHHPNIVSFKGVTLNPLQLVSEWIPSGDLRQYIKRNPDANPINLLLDIAKGLAYLHACDVIHGDLKGSNVVVDGFGNARITGIGLANIARDPSSVASGTGGDTLPWTAPEMLRDGKPASKKSDAFSFAMVMFEVFAGKDPFYGVPASDARAKIINGERPSRPIRTELTDLLWALTQRYWAASAEDRPEVEKVIEVLTGINVSNATQISSPQGPSPATRHPLRNLRSPVGETLHETSGDGDGHVAPYDVDAPPPVRALQRLSKGGEERPTSRVGQVEGDIATNKPAPRSLRSSLDSYPPVAGSTVGALPENLSESDKSETSFYSARENNSRFDPVDLSRRNLPGTNGHAARNASHHELPTGTKSHRQSRQNPNETPDENQTKGDRVNMPGPDPGNPPKRRGPWRRLKQILCQCDGPIQI